MTDFKLELFRELLMFDALVDSGSNIHGEPLYPAFVFDHKAR